LFDDPIDRIVAEIHSLGASIHTDGERLALTRASRIPPQLIEDVRQHKPELLARLGKPYWRGNVIVIPFDSNPRFHWWRGGQALSETRREFPKV